MNVALPSGAQAKDAVFRFVTAIHREIYRRTDGRLTAKAGRVQMLLLTTTGRRTGKPRTTPLFYMPDGDRLVLVASYGGDDRDPQWFKNLTAHPDVTVQIGGETRSMRAAVASAEEKARLWPRAVELYGGYDNYQRRTERDIPLVVLTPS
ncbi:MAG TPA: nitroreductase family deazaflavin-dependent oxidoreductase [Acidimicrobiia bacterium]|nr:nitroreductase family deazaflavin-dependent oxidoreductase [Acidimicrobiia bacterium]